MQPSTERVLDKLRSKNRQGVTGEDFPKMTSYSKRISELRRLGYKIMDDWIPQDNGGRHKKYFLIGEPKCHG